MDTIVDHLKATLSEALDIFYPLAGHLAMSEDSLAGTATYYIDCRANGATFVHATAEGVSIADLVGPVEVPRKILAPFYPMNGTQNYDITGVSKPLLVVQATEIADGVVLGFTASHVAIDATSFWHFLRAWSHVARRGGRDAVPPPPPVFERRELFEGIFELPLRIPNNPSVAAQTKKELDTVRSRIFEFSKETIAKLKAKANSSSSAGGPVVSSYQALLAHLWVSVTRSRQLDPSEEVNYLVAVGLRPRLRPQLPDSYFGNAVTMVIASSTAGDISNNLSGFEVAARRINEAISSQTPAEVRRGLAESARRVVMVGGRVWSPPNMMVTGGSPRFDMLGNDFGWGPPVAVRHGGIFVDGLMTPMPGSSGDGSVEFEVCLSPPSLLALAQDPEFAGRSVVCH